MSIGECVLRPQHRCTQRFVRQKRRVRSVRTLFLLPERVAQQFALMLQIRLSMRQALALRLQDTETALRTLQVSDERFL